MSTPDIGPIRAIFGYPSYMYNCSNRTAEQWAKEGTQWPALGMFLAILGTFYFGLYVPSFYAIIKCRLTSHSCYRIMSVLIFADVLNVISASWFNAYMAVIGGVFCTNPFWSYLNGMFTISVWNFACYHYVLLAVNRLCVITGFRKIDWLFERCGGYILWLVPAVIYAIHNGVLNKPFCFNSRVFAVIQFPFIQEPTAVTPQVISKEDKEFTLSKKAAQVCGTINHYAENTGLTDDEAISKMEPMALPNVSSESLHYIIRWCEQHRDCPAWQEEKWWENKRDAELTKWEKEFMAELTSETSEALHDVYLAANYMDIKCLLDKCAQTIADMIKEKSPEEIREIWGVENDFTPEEEEAFKNEDPWKVIFDYQERLEKEEEAAAEQGSSLAQA